MTTNIEDQDMENIISFKNTGYCVFKVYDNTEIEMISNEFLNIAMNSPELNTNMVHDRFVTGSVGYCPFASVWYNPFVRKIHTTIYETIIRKQIFKDSLQIENNLFSMLPDRPLVRFNRQKVDEKGKWHQDDAANAREDDLIYGGWINLNFDESQYFKCIPGSQNVSHPVFQNLLQKDGKRRGYANFKDAKDQKFITQYWKENINCLVEIPPGYAIVFQENIIHTVFRNPPTQKCILRQHISALISSNTLPLNDRPTQKKFLKNKKIIELFDNQDLVPVRSGQKTPVYSPLNKYPKNLPQLHELSSHYIEACKDTDNIVKRYLPSMRELTDLGVIEHMHDPLTQYEINIYIPHKIL
jgi:hypothetical protein